MLLHVHEQPRIVAAALERLPSAVLIVGAHGEIVLVNGAVERLLGYGRAELIGATIDLLLPDGWWSRHASVAEIAPDARPSPEAAGFHLSARRKDGSEVPIDLALSRLSLGSDSFVVASVLDASDRRRLDAELWALRDDRLQFETLAGELGAELLEMRPGDADRAIEDALERVVRTLDLDRSVLFCVLENGDFELTHQWTRPGWPLPETRLPAGQCLPWHLARVRAGELAIASSLEEIPSPIDRESLRRHDVKSVVTVPLTVRGRGPVAIAFAALRRSSDWTADMISRLRVVALVVGRALARKEADDAAHATLAAAAFAHAHLRNENAHLRQELEARNGARVLVGHSAPMRRVLERMREAAASDASVLLSGEAGTGKSLAAAHIHERSARAARLMISLRCTALSAARLERALFGATASVAREIGGRQDDRPALPDRSTIYLDDVAALPLDAQAVLVRFIDQRAGGASAPRRDVDVRVIAGTQTDLRRAIAQRRFREDLLLRLREVQIPIPPLRDRPDDIPLLVWRFVDEFSESYRRPIDTISRLTMDALQRYRWPGNVRELRNVVERAVIIGRSRELRIPLGIDAAAVDRAARRK